MFNDFAVPSTSITSPPISLMAVWYVLADTSYDVFKGMQQVQGDVFWRTISGQGKVTLKNGQSFLLEENTLLRTVNHQVSHYFCSGQKWEFWWFNSSVGGELDIPYDRVIELPSKEYEVMQMQNILGVMKSPFAYHHEIGNADFLGLLYRWISGTKGQLLSYSDLSNRLEPALWHIHQNYSQSLTVEYLASLCNFSVRRFRDLFFMQTGKKPVQYIRELRLDAAENYLLHTSLPIAEIAVKTGFNTEQYFCRVFRRKYGQSPGAYRKAVRG